MAAVMSTCGATVGRAVRPVASIGNNSANAISENEPNHDPDCESDCEVRHHIT